MARPRIYKTEAVVLKQTPVGEADRILTFCTPEMGKVRAVARGIRRTRSRMGGHLEILNRVSMSLARGRNLDVVTEAQVIQVYRGLSDDLGLLSKGLYIAELVDGFLVEHSHSHAVYALLTEVLTWLERGVQPALLLRYAEMRLLDRSGFRPELHQCVECRETLEPGDHVFSCSLGGVLCPRCRLNSDDVLITVSLNAMKVLRFIQRQESYDQVSGLRVSPWILSELERLLRSYIRFLVERELKTAEFVHLVSPSNPRLTPM